MKTRSMAVYKEEIVWTEWKPYDPEQQFSSWSQQVEDRVSKLAVLLGLKDTPAEFSAPRCLGYFHDEEDDEARFGLVYRKPEGYPDSKPVALLDLFRQAKKPSLTQRIRLAHNLSESVMYLHSINWLHKGIRSENIIFFPPSGQVADYDALGQSTTRSKKTWDIYSQGVVLVEIAFWRSIEDILDVHANQKNAWSRLRKAMDFLLEDQFLDSIEAQVGERYKDCGHRCIRGGADLAIRWAPMKPTRKSELECCKRSLNT
ncbi:hypothetical protein A1O7_06037 [Cladophialophora yegresii CBS 114405]|uniref:Protein kinase domain-containing protein n=1 Tax=Cladophialophora yegresii CBS 114405 TaxID=1182544 RepID=W9W0W1_9EURO|nr:uncharacterized protein A1O7_06037 [Cladophialophora yegresii CBS 114405]EXJ58610.1 hypothetical protein A1O7_06037 [Cladophialophora yegresii CBS 114405]